MKLKIDPLWFSSPTGQLVMVGVLAATAVGAVAWQRTHRRPPAPATVQAAKPPSLPRTLMREGARFVPIIPSAPNAPVSASSPVAPPAVPSKPAVSPLALYAAGPVTGIAPQFTAPSGRMIPCETVVTLESTKLDTPVIGLVSENVWHRGKLLIPAGAEVHGRARLDRDRERLVADGSWTICWPGPAAREIRIEAVALAREADAVRDGAAGLAGDVLRTDNARELKLFAATFLSAATAALQEQRTTSGLLGETSLPAATARNATLAGTGAILRDYAQQVRESIARDGFYLRVPAGQPFTLYVTQPLPVPATHEN
jgi:hypothetical protein